MSKPKAIILMGPTASGKTNLAVRLAIKLKGEIISADSRQVYKNMDIGTGKDLDEYGDTPYHLISVVEAGAEFSVSDFQTLAWKAINQIIEDGQFPIICGGTGHYIKALLEDYQFTHKKSDLEFTGDLERKPTNELHQQLKDLGLWDIHHWKNDSKRRMARAIEKELIQHKSQQEISSFSATLDYRIYFTNTQREELKKRIKHRLIERLDEGMTDEAKNLLRMGVSHDRLERYGLEYKYLSLYIKGDITRDQLIEKLCMEISRFAKRQMTFIRYMERNGHQMIPVRNFTDLWEDVSKWMN